MNNEKIIRIRIDEEILDMYQRLCEEHASNISAMTRKLIADWIDEELQDRLKDIGAIYISSDVDANEVAKASVILLTGMTVEAAAKAIAGEGDERAC